MTHPEARRGPLSRRGFMSAAGTTGLAATLAGSGPAAAGAAAVTEPYPASQAAALRLLMQGNQRWVRGRARHPHQSVGWRHHVAGHQEPFATVVSCIDSRVPPEIVFDRGLGDLFVIRTGAQALDQLVVLGSVEFGPNGYPSSRLIVVLGHARCGAVTAKISAIQTGQRAPGHIQAVVNALRPAYRVAIRQHGDLTDNMIRAQTRLTVRRLKQDALLRELIVTDGLMIVGGHYDLDTGRVQLIA
jgi:carbonic anhydrase